MSCTANGLSKIILLHSDIHGVGIFVNDDGFNIGRSKRIDHQLRGIVIPQNDIDSLTIKLIGNCLNTRTAHADTSTDRVHTTIIGFHSNFCT